MWIWFHAKQANIVHFDKRPNVGDVVFFNNTFDINRDSVINDWFSHVGIVESIDADGTITFVQRGPEGIGRRSMNLMNPQARRDPTNSKVWNSVLRFESKTDPAQVPRLSSELFAGFAAFAK
jgi:surface antigen